MRIAYQLNGAEVEEWLTAVTYAAATPGPTFNPAAGGLGRAMYFRCGAYLVYALRAPAGQLEAQEGFFRLLLGTVRTDAQWRDRVTQVAAHMNADNSKAAMAQSEIIRRSGEQTSAIIHDTYANKTKAQDRAAEGFSQYIRGVQSYRNPVTGETVELSNEYGHAWMNGRNKYVLSDSPNFNPNQALRGNWTQLEAVRR